MNRRFAQLILLLLFALFVVGSVYANESPLMRVTFLDVHQGDCILIRTAEKTIMIDAGDDNRGAAQRYIIPYLKSEGIKKIDQAIISHPHRDHFGGFIDLVKEFEFGEFIYSNDSAISSEGDTKKGAQDTSIYGQLRTLIMDKNIPYRKARLGEKLKWGKGITAEVLHCDVSTRREEEIKVGDELKNNPNELSIVIKATAGEVSYLFTGDAEKKAETEMISRHGRRLKSSVLKSGHHGSKSSSIHAFMDIVRPEYGVISVGEGNSFGHPTQSVLDIYDYHKMSVFRTDKDGHIESHTDGKTVTFVTKHSPLEIVQNPELISLTANSATLQWVTNRPGTAEIAYGAGSLASKKALNHESKTHTMTLTGLKPSTTYTFKAMARDPRETTKVVYVEGSFNTPAGSSEPLPRIGSMATNYQTLYMKHPFKFIVPVGNTALTAAKNLSLDIYHSAMDESNLIGQRSFNLAADTAENSVFPIKIDWLGNVELIAVLRQGKDIIDTASLIIEINAKTILVDAAHGNKDYFTGRFAGMKMDLMQSSGFDMRSISRTITYDFIKDAFLIIIPHPTIDFKKTEITALKKFVSGGGSLMMFGQSDYGDRSNPDMLNSVLKGVGSKIRFNDDQACEPEDNIGPPWRFFARNFPHKEISGNDVSKLLLRSCGTLLNADMKGLKSQKNLFVVATLSDKGFNQEADEMNDGYIYASHTPLLPIPIAAVEDLGSGRVAAIGDQTYQDNYYSNPADLDTIPFNRNIVVWLSLGKAKTIREMIMEVAELDNLSDPELRVERFDHLSSTIMEKIRDEMAVDKSALSEYTSMMREFDASAVHELRMQVEHIHRFDSLHDY